MILDGESGDEKTTWRRIETSGDHFGITDSGFGHTASKELFAACFLYSSFKLYVSTIFENCEKKATS